MPEINKHLQDAFQEVAFRANRLREWLELERYLRNLSDKCDTFEMQLRSAQRVHSSARLDKLTQLWNRCQNNEIMELKTFSRRVDHIKGGHPVLDLELPQVDFTSLLELVQPIQTALMQNELDKATELCLKFQAALAAQRTDREALVSKEMRDLCELTNQLRGQLDQRKRPYGADSRGLAEPQIVD
jgi:hypothetical protein